MKKFSNDGISDLGKKLLEEAAANLADPNICKTDNWIAGAKYQAERMYSEEDLKEAYKKGYADGQINTFTNIVNGGK